MCGPMVSKIRQLEQVVAVWSKTVGVTVWEILTFGARPYPNLQASEIFVALQSGIRQTLVLLISLLWY